MQLRILFVEDSADDASLVLRELKRIGYEVDFKRVETENTMRTALTEGEWDIVICDYSLPSFGAPQALEVMKASDKDLPFIILSGTIGEETAVAALKAGAHDFMLKANLTRLGPVIQRELREAAIRRSHRAAQKLLTASEARLRALFASMQDIVLVIDQSGVYRQIAPTHPDLLYARPEELLGKSLHEVMPRDKAEEFMRAIKKVLESQATARVEYSLIVRGHLIWFDASISKMAEDLTLWVVRDITERKEGEEKLFRSEERFRNLYENATISIYQTTPDGQILLANPALIQMLGYSSFDELAARNLEEAGFEPSYERVQFRERVERNGEIRGLESGWTRKDGTTLFVRESARTIKDAEGKILSYEGTVEDITERRQAEQVIQRDLAEFQMLYESGLALNRLMNPKEIAQRLIDLMSGKLDWHHTAIRLYHQEDESLELLAFNLPNPINETELRATGERMRSSIVKIGDGLTGWAAQHHQVVRVGDVSQDTRYREVIPGLHSGLYVPMQMGERLVGIISIESEKPDAFREADERLVVTLTNQAAIALENGRSFEDAQRRLRRAQALREVDQAIAGSMNLSLVLEIVLEHAVKELGVDAAAILLYDPAEQILKYELGRGFRTTALQHTRLHLGDGYAGRAALSRQTIYISDLQTHNTDFLRSPTFHEEGFACYIGVPLIAKGEIRGVMEIFHRTALDLAKEWLDFMETLAGQIAIAIDNATLFRNLQQSNFQLAMAYDATIEGWSKALDLRDKETEGHTQRVTQLAMRLARAMGVGEAEIVQIQRGGLLHDIGKMGVPDGILLKAGALTEEEWVVMKKHPVFAYEMLAPIQYLHPALDIPYCHHEKWDGTGYPRGLKGEQIPLAARIFAVVDVYDALTSDRPYRPAWTKEDALKHIRQGAGSHFELQIMEKFISMIDNDG